MSPLNLPAQRLVLQRRVKFHQTDLRPILHAFTWWMAQHPQLCPPKSGPMRSHMNEYPDHDLCHSWATLGGDYFFSQFTRLNNPSTTYAIINFGTVPKMHSFHELELKQLLPTWILSEGKKAFKKWHRVRLKTRNSLTYEFITIPIIS